MPYLQFQSLGDGNCLYNTQAVWLIYAYQQQFLTQLFLNDQTRDNFAKLLIKLGEQNPQFGLPKTLAEINSVQALQMAFDTYIAHLTTHNGIDWIKVQLTLANALRSFVVETIKTDPRTNAAIKENLSTYLEGIAQTTHELSSLQEGIRAVRLEFTIHFDSQTYRIPSTRRAPRTVEAMKQAIENELLQFIDTKMAESSEKRAQIIDNVKDELKRLVREKLAHSKRRAIHTLRDEALDALRNHLQNVIKGDMADDTMTFSAHFQGMPEIEKAIKTVIRSTLPTVELQQQALKTWFFENDAKGFNLYLSNQGGIATNNVDAGELEQKVLSNAFNHVIVLKSLRFEHQLSRVVNGLVSSDDDAQVRNYPATAVVFEMEKQPGHWNALLPDNEVTKKIIEIYVPQRTEYNQKVMRDNAKQELVLKLRQYGSCDNHRAKELPDISIADYCLMYNITQAQYLSLTSGTPNAIAPQAESAQTPRNVGQQPEERDWTGYSLMFIAMVAVLGTISHGIVWPLVGPLVEAILPNGTALLWTQISSYALFSTVFGFILTEKIFSEGDEQTANIDPPMTSPTTAPSTTQATSWWPTTSLLPSFLFQREQAPSQQAAPTTTTPALAANPSVPSVVSQDPQPGQPTAVEPKQQTARV